MVVNRGLEHVLLVEDDELDQENIIRAFKKKNISNPLHIANDGVEALNMLLGKNGYQALSPTPSMMLLDINMPRMNGIELLARCREIPALSDVLVFILTTSDSLKDFKQAQDLNVAGYLLKPIQDADFVSTMARLDKC